ncbi:MAG: biosynthetic-type acetolactate synthase large subunit [Gemmatimonadales bacterium]|nr:biosynthetic-type acetolactate synthase large subunit [Gemmatimonadales bacterium]
MPDQMTGADIICRVLEAEGVTHLFGYPGGAIMPFYHALPDHPALRHILVRHEQAAAHAADGWGRATGRPGVCVATSGPGATNLVTGLACAMMDGSPLVAITGQVPRALLGKDAFQETDIVGIALPITKHAVLVEDIGELADRLHEAFRIAVDGRPGPVLVDIPKDVQQQRAAYVPPAARVAPAAPVTTGLPTDEQWRAITAMLDMAERPLILAGRGVLQAGAEAELARLAERTQIPVVCTLLGLTALPEGHPQLLGMPGMHGEVHVNRAIQHADVILGVGLRFDDRVTGATAHFAKHARIIHVDVDRSEIGKNVPVALGIACDAKRFLGALLQRQMPRSCDHWRAQVEAWRRTKQEEFRGGLAPERILQAIHAQSGGRANVVADVGQHQMWVAKHYPWAQPNSHFSSGGLGAMGFAVPAAMGVALARPGEPVWAISGDGGFQMNMQEMATLVQERIPVKLAVFNNGYLGMVRQWQQAFHGGRYSSTPIWSPDYAKLAEAYGIRGVRVEHADDLDAVLAESHATDGPCLVEFMIEEEANVLPMIPPGGSLSDALEEVPARPAPAPARKAAPRRTVAAA